MKTYARIQDSRVAELLTTEGNMTSMFHRDLAWIDVSSVNGIAVGWDYDGQRFSPPAALQQATPQVTLSDLPTALSRHSFCATA
jgi:hypothetical protein